MNELLALLGLAWPRILLYPGGLFALLLAWLWQYGTGDRRQETGENNLSRVSRLLSPVSSSSPVSSLAAVPPLLAISLLPLPFAAQLSRSIDLLVALALLEWPAALLLARLKPDEVRQSVSSFASGYGLLLPSILALVQATRSFSLDALVAQSVQADLLPLLLRLAGVAGWGLALVPLLGLGPFRFTMALSNPTNGGILALRAVGHILVATLPLLALRSDWWFAPLPPLVLGLALVAVHRWVARPHIWEIAVRGATALLWVLLAWASVAALLARAT